MERYNLNKNLAQMLRGGVIMNVTNAKEAKISEDLGETMSGLDISTLSGKYAERGW